MGQAQKFAEISKLEKRAEMISTAQVTSMMNLKIKLKISGSLFMMLII